jgi:hypothetical protein
VPKIEVKQIYRPAGREILHYDIVEKNLIARGRAVYVNLFADQIWRRLNKGQTNYYFPDSSEFDAKIDA